VDARWRIDALVASGQTVQAGRSIAADEAGVTLPGAILTEIELGRDAAEVVEEHELAAFERVAQDLQFGAIAQAEVLLRTYQAPLLRAKRRVQGNAPMSPLVRLYNEYVDELIKLFMLLLRAQNTMLAELSSTVRDRARDRQRLYLHLPRLDFWTLTRRDIVEYDPTIPSQPWYIVTGPTTRTVTQPRPPGDGA
jgi:hypothetical protein